MQWCDWVDYRVLCDIDDIAHAKLAFGRAFNAHLGLSELLAARCEQRFELTVRISISKVHFVAAKDHRYFFIELDDSGQLKSSESLDNVEIVHIVYQNNDAGSFNFVICLLYQVFRS